MKNGRMTIWLVAAAVAVLAVSAMADTFGTGDNQFTIDFVTIGNAGNAADTGGIPGSGSVGYNYRIAKYEITNSQWNKFISAAGAPTGNVNYDDPVPYNPYDEETFWQGDNLPTTCVSWYEAAQFCNYLTSGDKSKGAYLFSGNNTNPESFTGIDRSLALSLYGKIYVIPTFDEWYKAAYFKPDGSGYSIYSHGVDTPPLMGVDANYGQSSPYEGPWSVGSGTVEQNGTFDMSGNVNEWSETLTASFGRYLCGDTYYSDVSNIGSFHIAQTNPSKEISTYTGFRVASVPEPATLLLMCLGGILFRKSYKF